MRLRLEGYAAAQRTLSRRSIILGVIGTLVALWGGFWTIVFAAHGATQPNAAEDLELKIVACIVLGIVPALAGGFMVSRSLAANRRLGRLRRVVAAAMSGAPLARDGLVHALGITQAQADAALLDAAELGAVEDAPAFAVPGTGLPPYAAAGPAPYAAAGPAPYAAAGPAPYAATAAVPPMHAMASSGTRPVADNLIGQVLGSYRVERYIAAGGMGAVYAARHMRTGRAYALKVVLLDARGSPDAIKRFEREAMAAGSIGHPGIVAVHDFDVTPNGMHFLVMDLLEGETLEQRLTRVGTLPWQTAREIVRAVGSALAAAHARGFVHRDLKPSNVFFARYADGAERAVLLDFGLAKPIDAAATKVTATGAAVGTPLYMAPEQARGEAVDVRSDVYSLAAITYEIVTGAPPFCDATLAKVYARLLHESAAPASAFVACPPALDAVLGRALAKWPAQRYPDVASFLAALDTVDHSAALGTPKQA